MASHRRVSNAFEKSMVMQARFDVPLQLKAFVNSWASPIASVIRLPLTNAVWFGLTIAGRMVCNHEARIFEKIL